METFKSIATMIGAMGHQILVEGVFNGDPHPGNFLVMPDGKLGLIDFGQVKVLDDDIRLAFARLVKALANDDEDGIVQSYGFSFAINDSWHQCAGHGFSCGIGGQEEYGQTGTPQYRHIPL